MSLLLEKRAIWSVAAILRLWPEQSFGATGILLHGGPLEWAMTCRTLYSHYRYMFTGFVFSFVSERHSAGQYVVGGCGKSSGR